MNIFIDTALRGCNVVLFDENGVLAMRQDPIERGHAEAILPIYQDLLETIGRSSDEIQAVYVTVGPGSFTGLRVGLTVARFIGFSLNVPVHGVTTFQCFSTGCDIGCDAEYDKSAESPRAVLIETKRKDFYFQMMDENHQTLGEAQSLPGENIADLLAGDMVLTGDAVARFVEETKCDQFKTYPQDMLNLENIITAIQSQKLSLIPADPFYIRDVDVSMPKKKILDPATVISK